MTKLLCPEEELRVTLNEPLRLSSLLMAEDVAPDTDDDTDDDPLDLTSLVTLSFTLVDIPAMSKKNIDNIDPLNR